MSMASYRNPWKLSFLLCATCEIGIALLLLLQIAFAFLVFQLMKHFCVNNGGIADMDGIKSMKFCGYNTHIKEACVDDQEVSEEEEIIPSSAAIDQQITSRCGYVASFHQESCKRTEDSDNITDQFDQITQAFDEKTGKFDQKIQELDLGTQGFDECGVTDGSEGCSIKDRVYCCDHMDMVMRLEKAVQAERVRLHSVYTELEEERSAAESAANEAMAMILRLQEEKSALLLESAHFQRMAEEKAIHDEEAIRILEDNLCRKETECVLLEEKIDELRAKSVCKTDMNLVQKSEDCHYNYSSLSSPLPGWHEVCYSKGLGTIASVDSMERRASSIILESNVVVEGNVKSNSVDQINVESIESCVSVMTCLDYLPLGADTIALHESSSKKTSPLSTSEGSIDDNDATSVLFQLSALEKQLQASEARDLTLTKVSSKGSLESYGMEECESLPSYTSKSIAFNMEEDEEEEEEKVVNIDVAQMNYSPSWEAYIPEDICQVHEENKARDYQFQESEACEEELKHLDVPSLVSSISPRPISNVKERAEPEDYEGNWKFKRVTLEDIDSRLQSLETQTLLLRQQSIPSTNSDHENIILLKEIRGLLNVIQSTPNFKGGKPRKCLFPEDSEKCLD